jgi:CheY-like chemotaxis protein
MTRILIVEDDRPLRATLETILPSFGFHVAACADGESCLGLAQSLQPDVILLDIMLPGIDGLSAMELLRAEPSTRSIPVIGWTASGRPDWTERATRLGFVRFLHKPLTLDRLVDTIRSVVDSEPAPS